MSFTLTLGQSVAKCFLSRHPAIIVRETIRWETEGERAEDLEGDPEVDPNTSSVFNIRTIADQARDGMMASNRVSSANNPTKCKYHNSDDGVRSRSKRHATWSRSSEF